MPIIQHRLFIDKKTGDVFLDREVILPDADLAGRIAGLKAMVPAGMDTADPEIVRSAALRCDGCGTLAALDWDDPGWPDGWAERDDGDFCPACVARPT